MSDDLLLPVLTSVALSSTVSPTPKPPLCPSPQGHLFVLGPSQAHPWLRASVFIVLSARNIPSLDICMADSFSCFSLSSVSNFLSPALALSFILSYFIYSTYHCLKVISWFIFFILSFFPIRLWAPWERGSSMSWSLLQPPRLSREKAPEIHLVGKGMNDHHNSYIYWAFRLYQAQGRKYSLTEFSQQPSKVGISYPTVQIRFQRVYVAFPMSKQVTKTWFEPRYV